MIIKNVLLNLSLLISFSSIAMQQQDISLKVRNGEEISIELPSGGAWWLTHWGQSGNHDKDFLFHKSSDTKPHPVLAAQGVYYAILKYTALKKGVTSLAFARHSTQKMGEGEIKKYTITIE
jgi:hypothetical protein